MADDRTPYTTLIQDVAAVYQVPWRVLEAQVLVESSGDPFAFRYEETFFEHYIRENHAAKGFKYGPLAACSYGLLQIVLEVALELGFTGAPQDLFTDRIGLTWGAKQMANLLQWAHGNVDQALAAYNGGKGAALVQPYRTQGYVDRVHAHMRQN